MVGGGASQLGYPSSECFVSLYFYIDVISSHENGCKVTVECGNLESGAENSTCSLSSWYPRKSGLLCS